MPKIKDFLTALQNDFVSARVNADLQSVDIAKSYGNDELLSKLDIPVPRMKIKDVQIELDAFIKYNSDKSETLKLKDISNNEILDFSKKYFQKHTLAIVNEEKQKKQVSNLILKTNELTKNYSKRYVKEELETEIRINKIVNYFIKQFNENIIGIAKEYREKLDKICKDLQPSIKKENSSVEISNDSVEIEFSNTLEKDGYNKVKIQFNLVDDDLIWEVDKKIASNKE